MHLSPERATPLADAVTRAGTTLVNYGLQGLVTGVTMTYEVAANYKVLLENYNECYHCGPVHPELCRLVPAFAGGGGGLDWEDGVPHRDGAWTFTMSGTTSRAPLPGLSDEERTRHKGELVFPNLMLSASADHVAAFVLLPRAANRTDVVCSLLFGADEASREQFEPGDAAELWDLVNKQDWAVCESVQRGMSSRSYRHGWFAPMENDSLDIRRWLLPLLEERVMTRARRLRGDRTWRPWQRHLHGTGPQRARSRGPRAVRARPLVGRQPRHQPDPAAQLPHARLRAADPGGVRRLGPPRARCGNQPGLRGGWARSVPT